MAPLHFHPLGCPQGQHRSPHSSCFPQALSFSNLSVPSQRKSRVVRHLQHSKRGVGREEGEQNPVFNLIPDTYLALSALLCNFSSFLAVGLHSSLYACLETFLQKAFGAPTPPLRWQGSSLQRLRCELPVCHPAYLLWEHWSPPAKRAQKGLCCSGRVCLPWPCIPWNAWQAFWDSIGSGGWL